MSVSVRFEHLRTVTRRSNNTYNYTNLWKIWKFRLFCKSKVNSLFLDKSEIHHYGGLKLLSLLQKHIFGLQDKVNDFFVLSSP